MTTAPNLPPHPATQRHLELLARLDPDLLHPARLAGPHAWHPWHLTRHAPNDSDIRLVVAPGPDAESQIERITDSLTDQLTSPTWPPTPHLDIHQHPDHLTCHHQGDQIAQITIHATGIRDGHPDRGNDHYTQTGWPILDHHAALTDRINSINPTQPNHDDLTDLANWIRNAIANTGPRQRTAALHHLVAECQELAPPSHDRLVAVLNNGRATGPTDPAIGYLADRLASNRARPTDTPTRASLTR